MSKEITKAYIIQEIQDKFKLRELLPEVFAFGETVVPIYDIENHLKKYEIEYDEEEISGTGGKTFFVVPGNETWYLNGYTVLFTGAGAITIAGVYLTRGTNVTRFHYLDLTAAQTVSYAVSLSNTLVLKSGDTLCVNVDGYTSTQDLRMYIDIAKEEVR